MKNQILNYFILAVTLFGISCESNAPEPSQVSRYDGGVFISNEGNFGEADGSLSFINQEGVVTNNIFFTTNNMELGDVVQSLHKDANQLFIVVNNSNKVEVVSLDSLKLLYTLDASLPRYMTSSDGMGYLTEWVSFSEPGRVTFFNLETGVIERTVTTDFGAEGIILTGNKLLVSNNFSTTVSVINRESGEVTKSLEVGNSPSQMVLDANGKIWLVCAGGYDQNYNPLNDGKLVQIDPESEMILKEIPLNTNLSGKLAISRDGMIIYYLKGNSIYAMETSASTAPTEAWVTENEAISFYGIGVGNDGTIYASDAKGFAENGVVFQYASSGSQLKSYTVGRGPNGFVFN